MATVADGLNPDTLNPAPGSALVRAIDRWIYVFMALWFIAIVLAGFIPDSLSKIAAVEAGQRPPFPTVLHVHAVLMGAFLLLLLAQTTLAATGRFDLHRRLGLSAIVLGPAIVIVGLILVPTIYHQVWAGAQAAPPELSERMQGVVRHVENIMLLQLRIGILFPLFLAIAIRARIGNAGLHKRMMFLAVLMALPAGIDRIPWLPHTMPDSAISADLYTMLAIAPMFVWDVIRTRTIHRAYVIWLAINVPFAVLVHSLWDSPWWHSVAPRIMGV